MFDEPVYVSNCDITSKFGETSNSLLKYINVNIGCI